MRQNQKRPIRKRAPEPDSHKLNRLRRKRLLRKRRSKIKMLQRGGKGAGPSQKAYAEISERFMKRMQKYIWREAA